MLLFLLFQTLRPLSGEGGHDRDQGCHLLSAHCVPGSIFNRRSSFTYICLHMEGLLRPYEGSTMGIPMSPARKQVQRS